jgi:voltage-gated potassium channel Kch
MGRAATAALAANARVVIGDVSTPATWEEAGLATARSVGILGEDDLVNLGAALQVADEAPELAIVVRLFATDLADGVEQMLAPRGTVLSEIEVSAPALIQAALSGNEGQRVTIGGRILEVSEVDKDDPGLVVALCDVEHPTDVLPARDQLPHRPTTTERARAALATIPRRAYALLATIIVVFSLGTSVFAISKHLDMVDSMYFTATTMATVGYGDVNLLTAPDWLKLFDIGLMAISAVLLASVLAFVTDQLAGDPGGVRRRPLARDAAEPAHRPGAGGDGADQRRPGQARVRARRAQAQPGAADRDADLRPAPGGAPGPRDRWWRRRRRATL